MLHDGVLTTSLRAACDFVGSHDDVSIGTALKTEEGLIATFSASGVKRGDYPPLRKSF